jgi:hypothetical protein
MRSLRTRLGIGLALAAIAAIGAAGTASGTASVRVERAQPAHDLHPPVLARAEAPPVAPVAPIRFAPIAVTAPATAIAVQAISQTISQERQIVARESGQGHQHHPSDAPMPFEYLAAFAVVGATKRASGTKSRPSRSRSTAGGTAGAGRSSARAVSAGPTTLLPGQPLGDPNQVVKKPDEPEELTAGERAAAAPNATIPQDKTSAEFNRRSSRMGTAAQIPMDTLPAEDAAPKRGSKKAETASTARAGAQKPKRFDETVPGGRYKGTDGKFRNAHGELHEDQKSA